MPWEDITAQGKETLALVVFEPPCDGAVYLPGLATPVKSAALMKNGKPVAVIPEKVGLAVRLKLLGGKVDGLASVIRVELAGEACVDQTRAVHSNISNTLLAHFAEVTGTEKKKVSWIEKFGEWKHANQVSRWTREGRACWTVNVLEPGAYKVSLKYRGKGRPVWKIVTDEGALIRNQQAATSQYQT